MRTRISLFNYRCNNEDIQRVALNKRNLRKWFYYDSIIISIIKMFANRSFHYIIRFYILCFGFSSKNYFFQNIHFTRVSIIFFFIFLNRINYDSIMCFVPLPDSCDFPFSYSLNPVQTYIHRCGQFWCIAPTDVTVCDQLTNFVNSLDPQ